MKDSVSLSFSFHLLLVHLSFSCCRGRKTKHKKNFKEDFPVSPATCESCATDGRAGDEATAERGWPHITKRKKEKKTIFSCPSVWSRTYKKSREPDTHTHSRGDLAGPE